MDKPRLITSLSLVLNLSINLCIPLSLRFSLSLKNKTKHKPRPKNKTKPKSVLYPGFLWRGYKIPKFDKSRKFFVFRKHQYIMNTNL